MFSKKYLIFNGEPEEIDKFRLSIENRAFKYGDSLFETMFYSNGKIHFFDKHFKRVLSGLKDLKYNTPDKSFFNLIKTEKEISRLITTNHYHKGVRIRMTIFRKEGGFYTPENNDFNYLIETSPTTNTEYSLNNQGLTLKEYTDIKKQINVFSKYKTGNSLIFVLAGRYKTYNKADDCIILNDKGNVCETISSNIFILKGKTIITPPIEEGCVNGIMRKNIIELSEKEGYNVESNKAVKTDTLLTADEVFLTNAISGIKWVIGFKDKRYFNKTSKMLINKLNESLNPKSNKPKQNADDKV